MAKQQPEPGTNADNVDAIESLRTELLSKMSTIQKELKILNQRMAALEENKRLNFGRVAAFVLWILFALVPVVGVGIFLYYMVFGL